MQDQEIIHKLKSGDEEVLTEIYQKYREEFFSWVIGYYRCDVEEAKDHYQFAILKLYENVMSGKLTELTSSIKTYLFAIGKNKVFESNKTANRFVGETYEMEMGETPTDHSEKESKLITIEKCLETLGEPCNSLLKQYYYHQKSMDQIADLFNYSNRDTAKNLKFKCLQRLRKLVKEEYLKVA